MFEHSGWKMQCIAIIVTTTGLLASLVGAYYWVSNGGALGIAFVFAVVGFLVSWGIGIILYGLGELIETTATLKKLLILQMKDEKWTEEIKKKMKKDLKIDLQNERENEE